jgi:pyruvate dehydrogenase E2 component (dihydrolipoamide acetyltransferase)
LQSKSQAPAAGAFQLPIIPAQDFSQFGPIEEVALSRIKRLSGPHLHASWLNIPHVTQFDEADITELEAFRRAEQQRHKETKITLLAFLLKACAATLQAYPEVNSSLAPEADRLILKRYIHIGIAVDTPEGLVVPVIRDVPEKGILALANEAAELAQRARQRKLKREDLEGGSFSISSLGGIGGTAFTPIVNAPQVAILGVSRSAIKPVFDGQQFQPRLMLPLSFSYDHRVVDGAMGARFTTHLAQLLGDLRRLLL